MSKTIIIDPGHGGADPGAVRDAVREKDINLAVALSVGAILAELGYAVRYTRKADVEVALTDRPKAAARADAFISIHCNAAENPVAAGIETWYQKTDLRGASLAKAIQFKAVAATGAKSRLVKAATDNIYVLRKAPCPAALIEMGFLSNEAERGLLTTEPYQQAIARAIAEGIDQYLKINL